MHVSVLGAGALGRVFGVRLAVRAKVDVELVVRRDGDSSALRIERVDTGEADVVDAPARATAIGPHADVVVVAVPSDQLESVAEPHLVALQVPMVVLSPMLPHSYARLRARLGDRLVAAMPNVTGYVNAQGVTRYWLSRKAKTLVDERPKNDPSVVALVDALMAAGIDAELAMGVHETNPATTIAFLPLTLALDAAGTIDALLADKALLKLAFRAFDEARAVGERVGAIAGWAALFSRFAGPFTVKAGLALARSRSPEAVRFVQEHFGRRVHAQNLAMGVETVAVAAEKGAPHEALAALLGRLRAA